MSVAFTEIHGLDQLAAALVKAQAEMKPALKDAKNPHFGSKYADLASIWEACREPLTKHGLCVIQSPGRNNGDVTVTTMLLHVSGQQVMSVVSVRPSKDDAQGLGSAITYLRRYALAAMVGIAPDDDDGEAAVGRPPDVVKEKLKLPAAKVPPSKTTQQQLVIRLGQQVDAKANVKGTARAIMGTLGIESFDEMTTPEYEKLTAELKAYLAQP